MIGDVLAEAAGGALRVIGRIFLEVVFEFLIKGVGYIFCRPFNRRGLDFDSRRVVFVGFAFWIAVGAGIYFVKRQL